MVKHLITAVICILLVSCNKKNGTESSAILTDNKQLSETETGPGQNSIDWFREAKFGLFLNWGLYSIPAGEWNGKRYYGVSEWLMYRAKIPVEDYRKLAAEFNPVQYDPEKWIEMAGAAGIKYIIQNAKYCDGFSMFKSNASEFNVVDASPFRRDILKEMAEACHKKGIKLGFYYTQEFEWLHPDARGNTWDYPDHKKNLENYIENMVKPQLKELLTNYGPVAIIWFDVPNWITPGQSRDLADFVHGLQPGCLVNLRGVIVHPVRDVITFTYLTGRRTGTCVFPIWPVLPGLPHCWPPRKNWTSQKTGQISW